MSSYIDWQPDPLPAGWRILDQPRRQQLVRELAVELSSGHRLFGQVLSPVAGCIGCDDTLVFVEDETRWAIVHPTWKGGSEQPPWPHCEVFDAAMPRSAMTSHVSTSAEF
ncbi:MAG: hypothetical protein R2733_24425 [Acidimicrobiales bacterium]